MQHLSSLKLAIVAVLIALAGCGGPSGPAVPSGLASGLQKGDDIESWNPIHVAGPNKGTNACPVCTYGPLPAVVIFTKNGANVPALATQLENLVTKQKDIKLKGFLIVLDSTPEQLKQMAGDLKITQIGICYIDPQTRDHDIELYKINPAAANTVMIYKNFKVTANFVNLDPADFNQVAAAVAGLN